MDPRDPYTDTSSSLGQHDTQTQGSTFRPAPETKEQVQEKTIEAIDKVQEKTGQAVDQVQQQAQSVLSQQKEQASQTLGNMAGALHQTAQTLRDRGQQDQFAQLADKASEQVDRFSTFLRDKDLGEITHEVEDFARKEPALFLSGAVALGLMAARFLRGSSQRAEQIQNYAGASSGGANYSGRSTRSSYTGGFTQGGSYGTSGDGSDFGSGYGSTGSAEMDYDTGTGIGTQPGYRAAADADIEAGYPSTSADGGTSYDTGIIDTQEPYMGPSERQRHRSAPDQGV